MHKRSIVLLGIFLGSHAPVAAQAPAPRIVLGEGHLAPIITMLRTVSTPLQTASFLLYQDSGKSPAHFSHVFAGVYEGDHRIERLPSMEEVKTLFFTQSSLPIVQLWGGRLQLDAFQSTFHIQNVQLGPLGFRSTQGFRSPRQGYSVGPRSVYFSGLSLSFHFGRAARTGRPIQAWRCLSRIVGNVIG